MTRVDLDQDAQWPPATLDGPSQAFGALGGVDANRQGDRPMERGDPLGAGAGGPDRIGDEDVVDAAGGHHFGLTDRSDRDAGRSGLELHPGECDALVGLDVGPKGDAALLRLRREPVDVRGDDVEIDDETRRRETVGQGGSRNGAGPGRGAGHRGRSTIGVVSAPSRSTRNVTSSPGSR